MTMCPITGKTALYGIIGYPVSHSLSPVMQNSAFVAAGIDAVYVPCEVSPEKLGSAISGMRALGFSGFNVTIPHKSAIIPFLDECDETAEVAGAANTVKRVNDRLVGYNTDGDGLVRSLRLDCSFEPADKHVVVYGAGGAARGAVAALCRHGVASVRVVNRTLSTAEALVNNLVSRYPDTVFTAVSYEDENYTPFFETDLLLNTTSLGMKGEELPGVNLDMLPKCAIVYDMVYNKYTPLLQKAEQIGLRCANGLGMLAGQGELAFFIWTGIMPGQGSMRRALEQVCNG